MAGELESVQQSIPTIIAMTILALVNLLVANVKGRRGDRGREREFTKLELQIAKNHESTEENFERLHTKVDEVRREASEAGKLARDAMSVCVGHDGKNGLRSRIEKLEDDASAAPRRRRRRAES